jgi:hypothetical protein
MGRVIKAIFARPRKHRFEERLVRLQDIPVGERWLPFKMRQGSIDAG